VEAMSVGVILYRQTDRQTEVWGSVLLHLFC
jgi:hypothetical protein